jgi:hypothetical protein
MTILNAADLEKRPAHCEICQIDACQTGGLLNIESKQVSEGGRPAPAAYFSTEVAAGVAIISERPGFCVRMPDKGITASSYNQLSTPASFGYKRPSQ